jgi:transcriptional coactivator HFI1/ADA1
MRFRALYKVTPRRACYVVLQSSNDLIPGRLSAAEFSDLTDSFLLASPQTEHAHNSLICAILYNVAREKPDHLGPAIWVTAVTDKSSITGPSKPNIASDAGEQRLKVEVMGLPARDRRRLKGLGAGGDKPEEDSLLKRKYEDYYQAGKIRVPENIPPSAGGLNKTNLGLEIRKRYTQPLFSETLEFPDAANVFSRMIPICYEESVASGSTMPCAELVTAATEIYVKDLLSSIFNRTRANGPKYDNGAAGGVATAAYLRQLEREEHDFRNGKIQRARDSGLLPVENREACARRPIGITDLKVASGVGRGLWNGMPLIGSRVAEAAYENEFDDAAVVVVVEEKRRADESTAFAAAAAAAAAAGTTPKNQHTVPTPSARIVGLDEMDIDDDDYGWPGGGAADRQALASLLEDCLSIRA